MRRNREGVISSNINVAIDVSLFNFGSNFTKRELIRNSQYGKSAHLNITHRRRQNLYSMRSRHWQGLAAPPINFLSTLERVDDAIDANADIASEILAHGLSAFGLDFQPEGQSLDWRGTATPEDLSKAPPPSTNCIETGALKEL